MGGALVRIGEGTVDIGFWCRNLRERETTLKI